jgi:gamma-glutamyl-gamma-aminobutyrate hydrolase PuuD
MEGTILTVSGSPISQIRFRQIYEFFGYDLKVCNSPAEIRRTSAVGVLLQGGTDVHPSLYGEKIRHAKNPSPFRDMLEFQLLQKAHDLELPILGVCRGMQMLNVFYGGSLFQDINLDQATDECHWGEIHYVKFKNFFDYKCGKSKVNSWHHQAVKRLAPGFQVLAFSEDGLIEAIGNSLALGVQWHPESDQSLLSELIFTEHIRRIENRMAEEG